MSVSEMPTRGAVFWPVANGDSTTIVIDDDLVMQVDLHDMAKAQDPSAPEAPVVDELLGELPQRPDGTPYLAVFALTHADQDHCAGFKDLRDRAHIGEIWATPRLWREYEDNPDGEGLCDDAIAFRDECERRVKATKAAIAAGQKPASGNRIIVVGYDSQHSAHAYDELPDEYKSGPGKWITELDGHPCGGRVEVFIHAPFADDCAAPRNETSLAVQITLIGEYGVPGKLLLMGDLASETIRKIFQYSEDHQRSECLEWHVLLAPHHCSKRALFVADESGTEVLQDDVLEALERHALPNAVVISSSRVIPTTDVPKADPPHRRAADAYNEIVDHEVICTMEWGSEAAPSPVIFTVDEYIAEVTPAVAIKGQPTRLASIARAAERVAKQLPASGLTRESGPDRVRATIRSDRGGRTAPSGPVAFGR